MTRFMTALILLSFTFSLLAETKWSRKPRSPLAPTTPVERFKGPAELSQKASEELS